MKPCILFLHGRYNSADLPFYKRLCRGKYLVAVDGGYRFFRLSGVSPDLLIGDFDSLKRIPRDLPSGTAVEKFPAAKDRTDAHLALDYCLDLLAPKIDIVQPSLGEPDQFVGNLMLLAIPLRRARGAPRAFVRIINARYEAVLIANSDYSITDGRGDTVSVVPLSSRVNYTCRGTEYAVSDAVLNRGDTRALRNRITSGRARFSVKGQAFLIRQFSR